MRYLCEEIPSKSRHSMRFKIDTKEIFHVISIEEEKLTAIMAEELEELVKNELETSNKSLILDASNVHEIDHEIIDLLNRLHQMIYAKERSFVICSIRPDVKSQFESSGVIESLNITPTESEAWDIVQMEAIERELGKDF
jgi:anti-anti-sigma regulatory factor